MTLHLQGLTLPGVLAGMVALAALGQGILMVAGILGERR